MRSPTILFIAINRLCSHNQWSKRANSQTCTQSTGNGDTETVMVGVDSNTDWPMICHDGNR